MFGQSYSPPQKCYANIYQGGIDDIGPEMLSLNTCIPSTIL